MNEEHFRATSVTRAGCVAFLTSQGAQRCRSRRQVAANAGFDGVPVAVIEAHVEIDTHLFARTDLGGCIRVRRADASRQVWKQGVALRADLRDGVARNRDRTDLTGGGAKTLRNRVTPRNIRTHHQKRRGRSTVRAGRSGFRRWFPHKRLHNDCRYIRLADLYVPDTGQLGSTGSTRSSKGASPMDNWSDTDCPRTRSSRTTWSSLFLA